MLEVGSEHWSVGAPGGRSHAVAVEVRCDAHGFDVKDVLLEEEMCVVVCNCRGSSVSSRLFVVMLLY